MDRIRQKNEDLERQLKKASMNTAPQINTVQSKGIDFNATTQSQDFARETAAIGDHNAASLNYSKSNAFLTKTSNNADLRKMRFEE